MHALYVFYRRKGKRGFNTKKSTASFPTLVANLLKTFIERSNYNWRADAT